MKTLILACKTLERELQVAMERQNCHDAIVWFESGLHNTPKKFKEALQMMIDQATDYDRILMAMSFCGNVVCGLRSGNATLVIPRAEDCISLVLGSAENRSSIPDAGHTYFMTEGWLQGERNIWVEYQYAIKKYGQKTGEEIFQMMLGNYQALALIDSQVGDLTETEIEMEKIAKHLHLTYRKLNGTTSFLEALFEPILDPARFLVVAPHDVVALPSLSQLY